MDMAIRKQALIAATTYRLAHLRQMRLMSNCAVGSTTARILKDAIHANEQLLKDAAAMKTKTRAR